MASVSTPPSHSVAVPDITVCICTFQRPRLLEDLLLALDRQRTNGRFTISTVVVDNDAATSARAVIARLRRRVAYSLSYDVEPRRNIALARNRAVSNARAECIAMIDDDEVPGPDWLLRLHETLLATGADGVLGPVRPAYPADAPRWLIRSRLCERPGYPTGTVLTSAHPLRTGNTLLHRRVFGGGRNFFREEYGLTGGEDGDFFTSRLKEGFRFVWCDDAPAYEAVPADRCTLSFHLRKAMRIGALTGVKMRRGAYPHLRSIATSLAVMAFSVPAVPLSLLAGRHVSAQLLSKSAYHAARVLASLGVPLCMER